MVGVICLMGNGFGMRVTLCTNQKIAGFWMKVFGVLRMDDVICFTPSGGGSPKVATCPGTRLMFVFHCFRFNTFQVDYVVNVLFSLIVWFLRK